jgi:putative transposase
MVSPRSKRRAVCLLVDRGFPRTCACRVCQLSRASSRYAPKERSPGLAAKVLELARANPRYGFRRVHALLPGVNLKAVHRVWREEGLALRRRPRRRLVVPKTEGPLLTGANQAWCLDFCHQRLENGRHARILAVLDCFTRECLLLRASSTFPAFAVERELEWLFLVHGKPAAIVSDNGPEFRAMTLPEGVANRFIQPGKPWQNGYVESFFGKLRDELLSFEYFSRGADLQAALENFQDHYNNHRPHRGLGGLTPAYFKEKSQATKIEEGILAV